jgi:uncharacterized protein YjiK
LPYDLQKPDFTYLLPLELSEVSGLTDIDSSRVACVADELGIIYTYNFRVGKVESTCSFDTIGDFEGLTYTGKYLFALRSDGRLTNLRGFPSKKIKPKHYNLKLLTIDNEGLCHDAANDQILIAAKSKPADRERKDERFIYAWNISDEALAGDPLYRVNTENLAIRAAEAGIVQTDTTIKGKTKPFNFRPSSLAVHPITDEIYILSAEDFLLVVMNRSEEIVNVTKLDEELFPKAEGITFLRNGTMIITSEAIDKPAKLSGFYFTP